MRRAFVVVVALASFLSLSAQKPALAAYPEDPCAQTHTLSAGPEGLWLMVHNPMPYHVMPSIRVSDGSGTGCGPHTLVIPHGVTLFWEVRKIPFCPMHFDEEALPWTITVEAYPFPAPGEEVTVPACITSSVFVPERTYLPLIR